MREFFKQILKDLYLYCGNRQSEKLTDDDVTKLCDILERVSKNYAYIPEESQKRIVENRLLTDKDYQNINARVIAQWFEQDGKIFFKELSHQGSEESADPLTGEARDRALKLWEESLNKLELNWNAKPNPEGKSKAEVYREQALGALIKSQQAQELYEREKAKRYNENKLKQKPLTEEELKQETKANP